MNAYTFSDVLIKPKYSEITSRSTVDISSNLKRVKLGLPIISANMKTITEAKMAVALSEHGAIGALHRFNTVEDAVNEFDEFYDILSITAKNNTSYNMPIVSVGVQEADKERFDKLYEAGARIFCIDVAHGHHILVKNMLEWIISKQLYDIIVIAGNVATADGAYDLADWGTDVIKVGIGPGSVCQTRQKTGVGVPQLYALDSIFNEFKNQGIKHVGIIADGGITSVGDICKALKFADTVMIGSMLSGTSETPGNVYRDPSGQFYKVYGGSASAENKGQNKFVEGMMKTVPFRGKAKYILREIEDGVKSTFSYVGANNMEEYKEKCEFQFITDGASRESKF